MKINNVTGIASAYQQNRVRRGGRPGEAGPTAKGDGIELSRSAQEVRAVQEKVSLAPEVRHDRVGELKQQIQAGTYNPDGREVAAKILRARVLDDLI